MKYFKMSSIIMLLLVLSLVFVACNSETQKDYGLEKVSNAYITIDINPSIEIITDDDGLVAQVNALNDDAIQLLVDTDFVGKTVDVVLDAILELAIEYGYIDFELENAVLISTASNSVTETEELENKISSKVQDFIDKRKIKVEVLKASLEATEDIKALAEQYNISVGKVKIITYALAIDSELTFEVAAKMSIRDLSRIIQADRNEVREFYSENIRNEYQESKESLKVEFKLAVKGLLNQYIQSAADEEFLELLEDSDASVVDVKALYQEYYDALLATEVPVEDEEDDDDEEDLTLSQEDQERLAELKTLQAELSSQLHALKEQISGKSRRELSTEEFEEILNEIKEVMLAQREVMLEINELNAVALKKDNNRFGFRFDYKWNKHQGGPKDHKDDDDNDLDDLYEDLEDYYEDLFADINIDLADLEEFFKDKVVNEIIELRNSMKTELDLIHETFKVDSKAIKDQLIEEKNILKEIWKKR